jgi:hypothetical protein
MPEQPTIALPSLLYAWGHSAAWALGCLSGYVMVYNWANRCNAFESSSRGYEQLVLLVLADMAGVVLWHTQAYKKFQRAYRTWEASQPTDSGLAVAWLFALVLLRTSWVVITLVQVLCLWMKGSSSQSWF